MAITLKPETEEKLRQMACWEDQDADAFADALFTEVLAQRDQELADDIAAVQEAWVAIDQGRFRPAAEFFAEHRRRFPDHVSTP